MDASARNEQTRKALAFRALHEQPGTFVIPNPWDAGSAKMLASLGYQALATTSAGYAFSQGKADGALSLDETLANVRAIVAATDLPVAVDLENGFADDPADCAQSLLRAAEAGAVGGSIEDATGHPDAPIYCFEHAVARIEAAVAAVRTLAFPFVLTARAENYLHGNPDINDTIRRLQAFVEAGADVLYAPGLRTAEEVLAVVRAVAPKPVNVLMSGGLQLTVQQLRDMGVRRVSTGSALALAAFGEFFRAAEEIQQSGTFGFTSQSMPYAKANQLFKG
ncbi:isocitrate lyase/phosphoenolpyruvate mutase family protein [Pseudomonas granadensis]|uniref:isocitrate lyase/PEP mutase family protein n=1 Tax=Pseudomonas granadensis TaxID=1421430 RepID=UPI0019D2EBDC|nr:isocitrate lyase/phosphoenolpyruvate mutase family protein [Pseudomonas granadensis]MBN6775606.1 isocitrate lyase/phosphoenolpyruvate mutase family protein [Pseudomonas granadensis]MBN6806899.1 isocitrate lyase/phosphoenolpyruvate mutase family protein [Pseudomonas granadensis]MBN6833444.1 isocitrate lyase/phosphoenolpyruvate mutase family protein [Pseudomonas granadensis]MBN6841145.1 isocitrate lyase/phosphoenolpyruvate mutase family protein [Pseudomonas granadensis]MBN6866452.1 isocitrate